MRQFGLRSIRHKLSLGVLLTTLTALFISGFILVIYDLNDFRQRILEDLNIQADLIGQSVIAAIQFDNSRVATKALSILQFQPRILAAAIYTPDNHLFAHYLKDGIKLQAIGIPSAKPIFDRQTEQLQLSHRITLDHETVGTVYILAAYPFYHRLGRDISAIVLVTLFALIVSMFMSIWIQARITRPILRMTDMAHNVIERRDFNQRAEKISDDEIGYLIEAFNNMLAEIGQQTSALQTSNTKLNQEVEEKTAAELALRNSELRLRTLVTSLTSVVWHADANGHFLSQQPQWQQYTGQTDSEYGGNGWINAFAEEDMGHLKNVWTSYCEQGKAFELQLRLWHATSHDYRYVNLHAVPLLDEDGIGLPVEWMGIIDDIHEEIVAHKEIQQLNEELEQRVALRTADLENANHELEAFSYSVSHDLRTPLRSIDGFSQALLEDFKDVLDATGQDYLSRVRAAAQRMGILIDDLLNLSRISRSEMGLQNLDLSKIARHIVSELQDEQSDRKVTVIISPDLHAYGDSRLLQIALSNLLSNAWKYTGKQPHPKIEFGITQQKDQTCFYIKDNGAGFDMNYAGRLFGAFQRLHDAHEFPGTGVGLAIVQRVIHRHGGHIWAEAEVNKGATFYFTLSYSEEKSYAQQSYSTGRG